MKENSTKSNAGSTTNRSRPFFAANHELHARDSSVGAERPNFFQTSKASGLAGPNAQVQAKSSEPEDSVTDELGDHQVDGDVVQRTPAFEGNEDNQPTIQRMTTNSFIAGTGTPFFTPVQAKLAVSSRSDPYEREADAIADRVVSGQPPSKISALQTGQLSREPENESAVPPADATAEKAIRSKGAGEPLEPTTQTKLESGMGHDLSGVRVHNDSQAHDAARSLNARAFTHGSDVWLGQGESQRDTHLIAHEATHVVQQAGGSDEVQRAAAETAGTESDVAPGFVELKDQDSFNPDDKIREWLDQKKRQRGQVRMQFGSLAAGTVMVRKHGDDYSFGRHALSLTHPAIQRVSEDIPSDVMPSLIVSKKRNGNVGGFVSLKAAAKSANAGFNAVVKKAPEVIGMAGFDLSRLPKVINKLEAGKLHLGLNEIPFRLGGSFAGEMTFTLINESVTFVGNASVDVQGLATGNLSLQRSEKGLITGRAKVALQLPKNFSGNVDVAWDGRAVMGEGKVGYAGEKLSGEIMLKLMDKNNAIELAQSKTAPPEEATAKPDAKAKAPAKKKNDRVDYVVFGDGNLNFAFTDWLHGTAHVIVDAKGFVTIIGKITPQKEFELFSQRDYNKELLDIEARARYGMPVVGNLFVFAKFGMSAFAKLGPAKFYKIEVAGAYSTDPEKKDDFSIKGSLNISAAAGLKLRGEVGAGTEILGHDLKAGGGVDATASVKGYAEATPIIGYREKDAAGEDKQGEFFIRGDLEIAAQPSFALQGDLFVEVDSPWWSPLPDKRWTWPLGSKEWPLGGSFGIGASVDYVFGSEKPPAITFPPVDFSAEKFTTDMLSNKTKPKAAKDAKEGKWNEKNAKAAEPPTQTGVPGKGVQQGKGKTPASGKPKFSKDKKNPPVPSARTADGKTVKEHKDAAKKGKQKATSELKGAENQSRNSESKNSKDSKGNRPTVKVPFTMSGTGHTLTFFANKVGAVEVLMASRKSLPLRDKFSKAHTVLDNLRRYIETIEDPDVRELFEDEFSDELNLLPSDLVQQFNTIYKRFFPPGTRELSEKQKQQAAQQVNQLVAEAQSLTTRISKWAAEMGVHELDRESVESAVQERGNRLWSRAWQETRTRVENLIGRFSIGGSPVEMRGSVQKGSRGYPKAKTRFDESDFDVDMFVVNASLFDAAVNAGAKVVAGKIFPQSKVPNLAHVSDQVRKSLTKAFPNVGRVGESEVALRRTRPKG